jgi:hypothetical protein
VKRKLPCPMLCKHSYYLVHEGYILVFKGEHSKNLLYGKVYKCRKCKRRRYEGLVTLNFLLEEKFDERNIGS